MLKVEHRANVIVPGWFVAAIPGTKANRAAKAKRAFLAQIQAFDDAIALARQKHHTVRALERAKTEYVHALLRRAA